jgi:hypothetical protein
MTRRRAELPRMPAPVAAAFDRYERPARTRLLALRRLIFRTAAKLDGVGPLTETLKWGQPSYLTEHSKSGSTIRLGTLGSNDTSCAVFFNCNTTLVESFRTQFADVLAFEKNRAVLVDPNGPLPEAELATCLAAALTYHRRRHRG